MDPANETDDPSFVLAGIFRKPTNLNNEGCNTKVTALQGCEDMWLDRESGLAYLPCVPPQSRAYWTPALLKLQYAKALFS